MPLEKINRIMIIGNAASGKTRLSRKWAERYQLPLIHVDSIQFLQGLQIRPQEETRKILCDIVLQEKWLIDGFGPFDLLEARWLAADRIVYIDLPIWQNWTWACYRVITNFWTRRQELPRDCNELKAAHILKLFRSIGKMHRQMRPELTRILHRPDLKPKLIHIQDVKSLKRLTEQGFS